jgi:hypothetical protein
MYLALVFNMSHKVTEKIQVRSASCNIDGFLAVKIQIVISSCTIDRFIVRKIQIKNSSFNIAHSLFKKISFFVFFNFASLYIATGRERLYFISNFMPHSENAGLRLYFINFTTPYVARGRKHLYLFRN